MDSTGSPRLTPKVNVYRPASRSHRPGKCSESTSGSSADERLHSEEAAAFGAGMNRWSQHGGRPSRPLATTVRERAVSRGGRPLLPNVTPPLQVLERIRNKLQKSPASSGACGKKTIRERRRESNVINTMCGTWKISWRQRRKQRTFTCEADFTVQVVDKHFRSELCQFFFFLLFLDQRLYNRFNYIIIGQSSKERKRTRISFYHWLLPWTAYNVNRKNPNHHRKMKKKKKETTKKKNPPHLIFSK